eukprot:3155872-Prymnesium_polylepis.2
MGSSSSVPNGDLGVVPRVVDQVFEELQRAGADCVVRVSYLEIYNEEVLDLLHPRTPAKAITIREDRAGDIFVHGVREVEVGTREELIRCLETGSASRTTGQRRARRPSARACRRRPDVARFFNRRGRPRAQARRS